MLNYIGQLWIFFQKSEGCIIDVRTRIFSKSYSWLSLLKKIMPFNWNQIWRQAFTSSRYQYHHHSLHDPHSHTRLRINRDGSLPVSMRCLSLVQGCSYEQVQTDKSAACK